MAAAQTLPPTWRESIRYDRIGIDAGELWRIVTGNFVHLTWGHYLLNATGLVFVMALFADDWRLSDWAIQLVVCAIAVSLGIHFLSPDIIWCVGLSGVLHGLFVYGAMGLLLAGERLALWMIVGVAAKLIWEQAAGELPLTAAMSGGPVVTDAHLWGALSGLAAVLVVAVWRRTRARV